MKALFDEARESYLTWRDRKISDYKLIETLMKIIENIERESK